MVIVEAMTTAPQRCPHSNPCTCEYITLTAEGTSQTSLRLKTLRKESILDYPGGPNATMWGLKSREPCLAVVKELGQWKQGKRCKVAGLEDGRRGCKPRNTGSL